MIEGTTTFFTIKQIKKANKEAGYYFFSPDTRRFFNSRILPTVYGGRYFITSERFDSNSPRYYTLREVEPSGYIGTIGPFNQRTRGECIQEIKRLLAKDTANEAT